MIAEIFRQLTRFRRGTVNQVLEPVRIGLTSREPVASVSPGSVNDGVGTVTSQTTYDENTGITRHVFMLGVDPLGADEAPLG